MIVTTNFIFEGFDAVTVWPFIFVRPDRLNDSGLIEHEMVHYREQRKVLTLPWLLAYGLSKRFRLQAEIRAYKRQLDVGGITVEAAAKMLTRYRLGVTFDQAKKLLA